MNEEGPSTNDQTSNKETATDTEHDTINIAVDDSKMKIPNENRVPTLKSQIDNVSNHIRKVNLNTIFKSSTCDENSEFCSNSNNESLDRIDSISQESYDDPNSSNDLPDSLKVNESIIYSPHTTKDSFPRESMKMDNIEETKSYNDGYTIGTVIEALEPKMIEHGICDVEKFSLDEKNDNNNTKVQKVKLFFCDLSKTNIVPRLYQNFVVISLFFL